MSDIEAECLASIGWAYWAYELVEVDVELQCQAAIEEARIVHERRPLSWGTVISAGPAGYYQF